MMITPINWQLWREGSMPIIEAKCESPVKETEFVIIQSAVQMIDLASKFKGVPYQFYSCKPSTFQLTVGFALIFPSSEYLTNFIQAIHQK